ncbi:hypothetical protein HVTV-2_gp139 [Haloarcula virus HVTV-2]|uniref:Uncharacterized protein n=1 Tax=Haloarcula vallismortis tailed virus 1 TaxID=1262528 RepID=L7TNT3_9CAUD|nr:hypothetical protein HVTV1_138 [Haloarcula vallismortis tailed virus 1]AGC34507.1 hypothetical protein HVTV1_138 [Haloarcula vallismortis tailed virus 1]UBF22946.1 hypothetical protein HVTV-2_gp139 [Haloarcula virus HVTV-2]
MVKSTFTFEEGEAIDVGGHGEHDYVFESGEPVTDSGISSLVFESGTGLGGGQLQYEINGGGLNTLETIKTAEPHYKFYDADLTDNNFDGSQTVEADHGYFYDARTLTVLAHENTNTGSIAIIFTYAEPTTPIDEEYDNQVDFSTSVSVPTYAAVWDGEANDESIGDVFESTRAKNGVSIGTTDGFGLITDGFSDITFTCNPDVSHPKVGDDQLEVDPEGWRLITEEGPPPDGGAYEWIDQSSSMAGSLRIVSS